MMNTATRECEGHPHYLDLDREFAQIPDPFGSGAVFEIPANCHLSNNQTVSRLDFFEVHFYEPLELNKLHKNMTYKIYSDLPSLPAVF